MWIVKRAGYKEAVRCRNIAEIVEEIALALNENVQCDIIIRKTEETPQDVANVAPRIPKEARKIREANPTT